VSGGELRPQLALRVAGGVDVDVVLAGLEALDLLGRQRERTGEGAAARVGAHDGEVLDDGAVRARGGYVNVHTDLNREARSAGSSSRSAPPRTAARRPTTHRRGASRRAHHVT
jgi:hypothetical protein